MFHFLSAFSSGVYITSRMGLPLSEGNTCSSTGNGYHFFSCDRASEPGNASNATAASAAETTAEFVIAPSTVGATMSLRLQLQRSSAASTPANHYRPEDLMVSIRACSPAEGGGRICSTARPGQKRSEHGLSWLAI